jgi:hypothetical protein
MGLVAFCNAVTERLTTVLEGINAEVPTFHIGARHLTANESPPRIVYVPARETWRGPHAQGGDGKNNPRPLRTRHLTLQVHIWAAGPPPAFDHETAVETLLNHFVAAVHDIAWGVHDENGGTWMVEQESATRNGAVYVLDMTVQIPATREPDTYATVASLPINGTITVPVATG